MQNFSHTLFTKLSDDINSLTMLVSHRIYIIPIPIELLLLLLAYWTGRSYHGAELVRQGGACTTGI
jgi:hypothetical protein